MKITAKQYARALFEEIKDSEEGNRNKIIKNFVRVLAANNHFSFLPRIIKQFGRIWNQNKGIVEAEIVSARELDEEILAEIKNFVKEKNHGKEVEFTRCVNKNLKGGFIIRANDKILDFSLANRLQDLANKIKE